MNKRLLFILPFLLLSFGVFAQLQKGSKILGGTISYSSSSRTANNSGVVGGGSSLTVNQYNNSPFLGYFLSDRTVVGLMFDINNFSSETTSNSGSTFKNEQSQFGFGPFVRRYFPVKKWAAFYGQAEIGFNSGKNTFRSGSNSSNLISESSTNSFSVGTTVGLAIFPTNWMSLDLAINPLSFTHLKTKNENNVLPENSNTNNFNFNLSTESIGIGAHFFFNKK